MQANICRMPNCNQEIYLRSDVRDTCERCRLRYRLPAHPADPTPVTTRHRPTPETHRDAR